MVTAYYVTLQYSALSEPQTTVVSVCVYRYVYVNIINTYLRYSTKKPLMQVAVCT